MYTTKGKCVNDTLNGRQIYGCDNGCLHTGSIQVVLEIFQHQEFYAPRLRQLGTLLSIPVPICEDGPDPTVPRSLRRNTRNHTAWLLSTLCSKDYCRRKTLSTGRENHRGHRSETAGRPAGKPNSVKSQLSGSPGMAQGLVLGLRWEAECGCQSHLPPAKGPPEHRCRWGLLLALIWNMRRDHRALGW